MSETNGTVQSYLQYVRQVLGVSHVMEPDRVTDPEEQLSDWARTRTGHWPPPGPIDLLVLHLGEGVLFTSETGELWDRMKQAMKLENKRVLEVESSRALQDVEGTLLKILGGYPAAVSLVLSETPVRPAALRVLGPSKVLETFSPKTLAASADLKRPSWADLQIVMKSLGIGKN